jgi:hypothetical protein
MILFYNNNNNDDNNNNFILNDSIEQKEKENKLINKELLSYDNTFIYNNLLSFLTLYANIANKSNYNTTLNDIKFRLNKVLTKIIKIVNIEIISHFNLQFNNNINLNLYFNDNNKNYCNMDNDNNNKHSALVETELLSLDLLFNNNIKKKTIFNVDDNLALTKLIIICFINFISNIIIIISPSLCPNFQSRSPSLNPNDIFSSFKYPSLSAGFRLQSQVKLYHNINLQLYQPVLNHFNQFPNHKSNNKNNYNNNLYNIGYKPSIYTSSDKLARSFFG